MLCSLAQGVRSREEPEETFLKGVPTDPGRLEIIYPVSTHPAACLLCQRVVHHKASLQTCLKLGRTMVVLQHPISAKA